MPINELRSRSRLGRQIATKLELEAAMKKYLVTLLSLMVILPAQFPAVAAAQPGNGPDIPDSPAVSELYVFVYDGIGLSGYSHGKNLYSELIQGADGNFYGTTVNGGSGGCADGFGVEGCGTIFKITPSGVQTVLFNFPYDSQTNTADDGI